MDSTVCFRSWRPAWLAVGVLLAAFPRAALAQVSPVDPALLPPPDQLPLSAVPVPDVNVMGLLDGSVRGWVKYTNPKQQKALQAFGKALFWDMQVGGDGIQACATCHYQAGADGRFVNQGNPGEAAVDGVFDLLRSNEKLTRVHFAALTNQTDDNGLPVSEPALLAAGATADDEFTGKPGSNVKVADPRVDTNDVVGSQGIRKGEFEALGNQRTNRGRLLPDDVFFYDFSANAAGIPDTVRQVTGRNSPTALNAVFNFRNFWDGRADPFFNGVSPLGVRDPDAALRVYSGGVLRREIARIPFSSLASQAVGPIASNVEVTFDGRSLQALGRLLVRPTAVPLKGQRVHANDSLLGPFRGEDERGLKKSYHTWIREIFDTRFWGDPSGKQEVCLRADGAFAGLVRTGAPCPEGQITLMAWNFTLFFGLGVQAYEATLVTGETLVDLVSGGVAKGVVTLGSPGAPDFHQVEVSGLSLDACGVALAGLPGGRPPDLERLAAAEGVCASHYAKFISPRAYTGSESGGTASPLPPGSPIGGCTDPRTCVRSPNEANALRALRSIARGNGSFAGGGRGCALCHAGSEFTSASVSAITGFGLQREPLVPGAPVEPPEPVVPLERMVGFDGTVQTYDSGFYNIGVRPTVEDVGLGGATAGVPMSWAKVLELEQGGDAARGPAAGVATDLARSQAVARAYTNGSLRIPAVGTRAPLPFALTVGCDPALGPGGEAADLLPGGACLPTLVAGERIQRNGAFKTPGLRNVKFTGPYFHNGSKATLRQVLRFYEEAGHFTTLNHANLHEAIRPIQLGTQREAEILEFLETGLTDFRVAFQEAPFDHPELCLPHGHDPRTGKTWMTALPAVGARGSDKPIPTFAELLADSDALAAARANYLRDPCTVPGVVEKRTNWSAIDVPPSNELPAFKRERSD